MIDADHPAASWFLWIAGGGFLLVYAIPLLVCPLRWARWFRWTVPVDVRLAEYFGRCLGAAAVAIVFVCLRAAPSPASHPLVFELVIVVAVLVCAVHVLGAIRRTQPWTEDAEIVLYALLAGLAGWLYLRVF